VCSAHGRGIKFEGQGAHMADGDFLPTDGTRDDAADVTNCETAADGVFSVI
jgi:hypothetical protein